MNNDFYTMIIYKKRFFIRMHSRGSITISMVRYNCSSFRSRRHWQLFLHRCFFYKKIEQCTLRYGDEQNHRYYSKKGISIKILMHWERARIFRKFTVAALEILARVPFRPEYSRIIQYSWIWFCIAWQMCERFGVGFCSLGNNNLSMFS